MTDPQASSVNRRTAFLLFILFLAPVIAGYLLFYVFPQFQPRGRLNYGTLIDPARPIPEFHFIDSSGKPVDSSALKKRWSYIYFGGERCDEVCHAKIIQIRQIRTRLSEKSLRVQRVYIAPDQAAANAAKAVLAAENPDLVFLADDGATGARAADFFQPQVANAIYLTDPMGNWLMVYPPDRAESKGIYKDIQKLLMLSHIG
ncbi:MAG: SCO family protein [Stenotrophobium sp.]